MGAVVGIFVFGCLVTATVALGLVLAMSALAPEGDDAFEGRSATDESS